MQRIPEHIVLISQRIQQRPSRWKRWLATGASLVLLVTSFFLGLAMLILALCVAFAVAVFVGIRIWWLRRNLRDDRSGSQPGQINTGPRQPADGRIIEGESEDISEHR